MKGCFFFVCVCSLGIVSGSAHISCLLPTALLLLTKTVLLSFTCTCTCSTMSDNNTFLFAAVAGFMIMRRKRRERRSRIGRPNWSREWLLERNSDRGMQYLINQELMPVDNDGFQNFLRMSPDMYKELLDMLASYLSRQNTNMRECVTPDEKLILTLRFLSSGI